MRRTASIDILNCAAVAAAKKAFHIAGSWVIHPFPTTTLGPSPFCHPHRPQPVCEKCLGTRIMLGKKHVFYA